MKKTISINLVFIFIALIQISLVNAQFYFPLTPRYWIDNPWVVFTIFFIIFFGIIYISLIKVLGRNPVPSAVIAASISLLVSAGIQREWQFLQKPILFWALAVILLLAFLIIIRVMGIGPMGLTGLLFITIGSWPIIKDSLPTSVVASLPYTLVSFLESASPFFVALFIIGIIIIITALSRALWRGRLIGRR